MDKNVWKSRYLEKLLLLVMFAFSISLFNMAGMIFSALVLGVLIFFINKLRMTVPLYLLFFFSVTYFLFLVVNYGFEVEHVVLYLLGPWMAYYFGGLYINFFKQSNALLRLVIVLSEGMFLHGILNLIAYLQSDYTMFYSYQRIAVDIWRNEIVSVTVTGMYLTFCAGLSLGALFSECKLKYKIISILLLGMCISASVFFANRTLLVIVVIIAGWKIIKFIINREISSVRKYLLFTIILIGISLLIILIYGNIGGIGDKFYSLKIVERFVEKEDYGRTYQWSVFFEDFNWIKYPLGGKYITENGGTKYLHNLWLDIYNTVGIVPFVIFVLFTINQIKYFIQYTKVILEKRHTVEHSMMQCLLVAIVLNCAVEPIMEANPYYFLITLMFLGAIDAQTKKYKGLSYEEDYFY